MTILDANRLKNDKALTESRNILRKTKEVMQRYRAKQSSWLESERLRISGFNVAPKLKHEMFQAFDKSVKEAQPKIDREWDLEEKIVSEVENIIDLLKEKADSWTVVEGKILFQAGQDVEKYNAFMRNIQRYATEEEQIKKRAVDAAKATLAGMRGGA